jgi:hypothetical protein
MAAVLAALVSCTQEGPRGPQGPEGPTGATGQQGLVGPVGATGPQGPSGVQGVEGPQGVQGIPGVPGPGFDRNKVYCNSVTMDAVQQTIDVTCDGDFDIPLSGSCDAVGRPGSYTLCFNSPQLWSGPRTGQPAKWSCGWCSTVGFVNLQGAKAWMCCVRP